MIDNREWPWCTVMVAQRHRLLYLPIAKNANTSLKRMMVRLADDGPGANLLEDDIHQALGRHDTRLELRGYEPATARRMLEDGQWFRFTLLREPLGRVASAWIDKFIVTPRLWASTESLAEVIAPAVEWVFARRGQRPDFDRLITFNEFVDYLCVTDDDALDTHFKSQSAYTRHMTFDYVGVVEHTDRLLALLSDRLGTPVDLEWINRTARRKRRFPRPARRLGDQPPAALRRRRHLPRPADLLTAETEARLRDRFATDIEAWREAQAQA